MPKLEEDVDLKNGVQLSFEIDVSLFLSSAEPNLKFYNNKRFLPELFLLLFCLPFSIPRAGVNKTLLISLVWPPSLV